MLCPLSFTRTNVPQNILQKLQPLDTFDGWFGYIFFPFSRGSLKPLSSIACTTVLCIQLHIPPLPVQCYAKGSGILVGKENFLHFSSMRKVLGYISYSLQRHGGQGEGEGITVCGLRLAGTTTKKRRRRRRRRVSSRGLVNSLKIYQDSRMNYDSFLINFKYWNFSGD